MFWLGWVAFVGWLAIDPGWHQHAQDVAFAAYVQGTAATSGCHWSADPRRPSPAVLCFQRGEVK